MLYLKITIKQVSEVEKITTEFLISNLTRDLKTSFLYLKKFCCTVNLPTLYIGITEGEHGYALSYKRM